MKRIKKIVLEASGVLDFQIPAFILDRYDLKTGDEIDIFEKDENTLIAQFKRK